LSSAGGTGEEPPAGLAGDRTIRALASQQRGVRDDHWPQAYPPD
jgi:hypothetical protein